jgi:iron complex transport system ATP-binding protein
VKLTVKDLSFGYNSPEILKRINLKFEPMITAIIGPNGAGKSTLIKCIAGVLNHKGIIMFNEDKVCSSYKEFYTKIVSYFPQTISQSASMTVFEAVLLGMLNSLSLKVGDAELNKVFGVLKGLEIEHLAERQVNQLSGGQMQMVSMAQALVKEPKVMLLDEPLNNLDIHHQFEILNLISEETYRKQIITVIAMHDLNLAARYADRIVVIDQGEIYASGTPEQVLTPEMIQSVYMVDAEVSIDRNGVPVVNPISLAGHNKSISKRVHKRAL